MRWALFFIGVLLMDTQTTRERSTATPGVPGTSPLHLCPLLLTSWSLVRVPSLQSKPSENDLTACRRGGPQTPMLLRNLVVDVATNSQHPTSTGNTLVYQPHYSASAAISVYFRLLWAGTGKCSRHPFLWGSSFPLLYAMPLLQFVSSMPPSFASTGTTGH